MPTSLSDAVEPHRVDAVIVAALDMRNGPGRGVASSLKRTGAEGQSILYRVYVGVANI